MKTVFPTSYQNCLAKIFVVVDKTDESLIKFPYWVSQGVFLLNLAAMLPYLTELYKD